jgi:hypothetical protein
MPHFGQLPGPGCLTSGCMGQVYVRFDSVFAGWCGAGETGLGCAYSSGAARNLAAQPWLQK